MLKFQNAGGVAHEPCSSTVIPNLALGLSLASAHMSPDTLDSFFRRMLVSRISRRVICEHHISLSQTLAGRHPDGAEGHVGIIYNELSVEETLKKCIDLLKERPRDLTDDAELKAMGARKGLEENWPIFKFDGHLDTRISYIRVSKYLKPNHMEEIKSVLGTPRVHPVRNL